MNRNMAPGSTREAARSLAPRILATALALLAVVLLSGEPAAAAEGCANEARRAEQGAGGLPDCRAYEMVTPAAKDGAEPYGALGLNGEDRAGLGVGGSAPGVSGARSAVGGDRVSWVSEYALPGSSLVRPYEPGTPGLQYLSKRGGSGWATEAVIPPQTVEYGITCQTRVGIAAWTPDLLRGVLFDGAAQQGQPAFQDESDECGRDEPLLAPNQPAGFEERQGFQNLFLRADDGTGYRLINVTPASAPHPAPPAPPEYGEYNPASFLAGSDDLSHIAFEEELPLTDEAQRVSPEVQEACEHEEAGCWRGHDELYEWVEGTEGNDTVRLVTVMPDGRPAEGMLAGSTHNTGGGRDNSHPRLNTPNVANFRHAMSADGSRIFFEAEGGLFVREDGAATVRIDAAQSGLPGAGDGGGEFMVASADGSKVYFTADASHLLTADTVPGSGANLYECDLPTQDGQPCRLTDLTPGPEAGVLGVPGANEGTRAEEEERGAYLYYVAKGVLAPGSPAAGKVPLAGQPNLYLRHGGSTVFIATLDGSESGETPDGEPCTPQTSSSCVVTDGDSCDWTARGGCKFFYGQELGQPRMNSASGGLTSRVSQNGHYLAFDSNRSLTGYDNEDAASGAPGEKMDTEIFVYDAVSGELSCASCNPSPSVRPASSTAIPQPAITSLAPSDISRAVFPQRSISNDGELFFDSLEALSPQDTGGARSLYAWKEGQAQLLSPGASHTEFVFLDADPDGSDVFFLSAERLVGRDVDTSFDVYDARVEGGFAESAAASGPCEGEAQCRRAAPSAPSFPSPATALFQGPGNERQAHAPTHHKKKKKRRRKHHHKRRRHGGHRHHGGHGHGHRHRGGGAAARLSAVGGAPAPGAEAQAQGEEAVEAGTGPRAVTQGSEDVTTTSAVVKGTVYREALVNSPKCLLLVICHNTAGTPIKACWFEYAPDSAYAAGGTYVDRAPCEPPAPYPDTGFGNFVEASLTGLVPHVIYHYRVAAENESGEVGTGEDRTFETLGSYGPPSIDEEAHSVSRNSAGGFDATLSAQIDPHGFETSCRVQFVPEAKFRESEYAEAVTSSCAPASVPAGFADEAVTASESELVPGGRYHYRFLARNREGEATGEDRTLIAFAVESFAVAPLRLQETGSGGSEEPYELLDPQPQDLRAGAHPYELTEQVSLSTSPENPMGHVYPRFSVVNAKDIVSSLPPGLIGNPEAVPSCSHHLLAHGRCDPAAQVGVLRLTTNRHQEGTSPPNYYEIPLYNLTPPPGTAAQLGAPLPLPVQAIAQIDAGVGPASGYAVRAAALDSTAAEGLISVTATIWGVPHERSHDGERFCPVPGDRQTVASKGGQCPSDEQLEEDLRPFLRNPTECSAAHAAGIEVDAWQGPGDFATASAEYPQMTDCEAVPFDPTVSFAPTTESADSPTGLHVDLHLPQPDGPLEVGEADLRKTTVALPEGVTVNPASASGLEGCSPQQIDLHGDEPASCPDASKIGAVEIRTPLVDHPLRGGVYVATPRDNPFNSLLAIYLAVDDAQTGTVVKLAGEVRADPATGRLTTTFDESPQVPFEDFRLDFFDGPRAALRTPGTCGSFTTNVELTPWTAPEGHAVSRQSSFQISSGPGGGVCASSPDQAPNQVGFSAGTTEARAGAYSPFVLRVDRNDGSQQLSGLSVTLPPGLTGRLAGVPYCPQHDIEAAAGREGRAELADPSCPASSQVGTVTVAAGPGPSPHYVEGRAYLAGPYKGAPLSLAIVTPAVAGPFDLGTVVVRTLLFVDRETAQIRAVSGSIPQILQGIPLDVRSIALKMDRPDFSLNPTSCAPMAVTGTALSALEQTARLSERFQVGGCDALPFAPQLSLTLSGATKRTGNPALTAVVTAQPGEANIAAAQVTLPSAVILDQNHIGTICTRTQFDEGAGDGAACPAESVYGYARARTPLLDQPLEGPVFLRSSSHPLPDLVAVLGGQIDVVLDGRIDTVEGRIRNTFEVVPDAPIESFALEMPGGKRGLLVNSTPLCGRPLHAIAEFTAQSGKVFDSEPLVSTSCHRRKRARRHHHRRHRHHHRRGHGGR